ncbi:hypothetical protein ACS8YF_15555 [Salinisphaera sp. SWV1]|uniref:hypothetical protein n=1 Tax=Salinisphaera sp. SWV1 TaxID=3454139 RepID=UPI003F83B4DD
MSNEDRCRDDLWEMVRRTDSYILASNWRTAFFLTYVFALLTVLYKSGVWSIDANSLCLKSLISAFTAYYVFCVAFVIYFSLNASTPNLGNSGIKNIYNMPLMGDLDKKVFLDQYSDFKAQESSDQNLKLAEQYHDLAVVAVQKFSNHGIASFGAKYLMPSAAALLLGLKIYVLYFH